MGPSCGKKTRVRKGHRKQEVLRVEHLQPGMVAKDEEEEEDLLEFSFAEAGYVITTHLQSKDNLPPSLSFTPQGRKPQQSG